MSATVTDTDWVLAAPFRAHVKQVACECGEPWRVIAVAAGVPSRVVRTLLFGRAGNPRAKIAACDARALFRVTTRSLRYARTERILALETRATLHRLHAAGFSTAELVDHLHLPAERVAGLLSGEIGHCMRMTAWRAAAMADAHGLLPDAFTGAIAA